MPGNLVNFLISLCLGMVGSYAFAGGAMLTGCLLLGSAVVVILTKGPTPQVKG